MHQLDGLGDSSSDDENQDDDDDDDDNDEANDDAAAEEEVRYDSYLSFLSCQYLFFILYIPENFCSGL